MKFISKWRIVLFITIAAIAIPTTAHVSVTGITNINEYRGNLNLPADHNVQETVVETSNEAKAVVGQGAAKRQDYYDRRREYWEKRVERRMEYEDEYGDDESGDDADKADAKDSKESKDSKKEKESKKAGKDEDDEMDQEAEMYERRREYWRERLDEEW